MLFTLFGIVTDVSDVQSSKVNRAIFFTEFGITIELSEEQP